MLRTPGTATGQTLNWPFLNVGALLLLLILSFSCQKTPDPNYLPVNLGTEKLPPWDAPIYSEPQLLNFFASANYSSLNSIYVSVSGDDVSGDGSSGNPYRTISHAVELHSGPGNIIRVRQGTYQEHLTIDAIGTQVSPYVLFSEDGPGMAIIDGNNEDHAIVLIEGEHVVLDGFEVRNSTGYGVQVGKETDGTKINDMDSYTVIRNCKVHTAGRDIIKSGHINYLLIEGCEIYNCTNTVQFDNAIDGVAVYYVLCRNNFIHDISPGFGGYFKSGSHNVIWSGNIFKDIGHPSMTKMGGGLQLGGSGSFSWRDDEWYDYPAGNEQVAYNNLFINCMGGAVTFTSCWNAKVYNNSMLNCGYISLGHDAPPEKSLFRVRVSNTTNQPSKNIEIYNNVSFHDPSFETTYWFIDQGESNTLGEVYHGHNTIYNNALAFEWGFPDGNSNNDNSSFFQYINDSLEVSMASVIVNTGFPNSLVLFDRYGQPRPIGIIDRGAYEK